MPVWKGHSEGRRPQQRRLRRVPRKRIEEFLDYGGQGGQDISEGSGEGADIVRIDLRDAAGGGSREEEGGIARGRLQRARLIRPPKKCSRIKPET